MYEVLNQSQSQFLDHYQKNNPSIAQTIFDFNILLSQNIFRQFNIKCTYLQLYTHTYIYKLKIIIDNIKPTPKHKIQTPAHTHPHTQIQINMNTQQKQKILTKFLTDVQVYQQNQQQSNTSLVIPEQFNEYKPPNIDLAYELVNNQKQISASVDKTYKNVKHVLAQLNQLQTRKQNINNLIDTLTAIKQVKKLAYGIGNNPNQIYRNLSVYYQIKGKVMYCDKYVDKVQEQIKKIKQNYQGEFQMQLRKGGSDSITQIAKILNIITEHVHQQSQNNNNSKSNSANAHIIKFYLDHIRKQLKTYEQDLFKIPIQPSSTSSSSSSSSNNNNNNKSYLFFQIAKDVLKIIVNNITNFKSNLMKIGGQQLFQKVVVQIFGIAMNGIMLQIFMREKKYFDMDPPDRKKVIKQPSKFKQYLDQLCAIWNQIQRLRFHLSAQLPSTSILHKKYQNSLNNCINTKQLLTLNSQIFQGVKIYTRYQFNNLLKQSVFVNSTLQLNSGFLGKICDLYQKGIKEQYQCVQSHQFLEKNFDIVMQALEKMFSSLNMLLISPFITFVNNHLIQQDSFHVYTQLFNKLFPKISTSLPSSSSTSSPQYRTHTAVTLILNTTLLMPYALKTALSIFKIPVQLQQYKLRLQNQLKQLISVCQFKVKQLVNIFISNIVNSTAFCNQLKTDYKRGIQRWKGLSQEIQEIFLYRASELHCAIILAQEFSLKNQKKIITQQSIISLQKQVRNLITFYQVKGCNALSSFRLVLEYIQVMLAENDQIANKLIKKFGIDKPEEVQKLALLRAMRMD